ncbi:class I SAM-dependent methyltransferase [Candidatus Fermentibacteria bacterium]|nr:class I SAM-dependent methyltransferase [Candidatus Fermentibacteria bacterium]
MNTTDTLPALYQELADWWPVLSSPEDYAEEARFYRHALLSACTPTPRTLLELGSGGGNNASHLKKHFEMTLVDLSPGMLRVSRELNPECDHVQGDMRTVRLGRQFDAVFIQDAIVYMLSTADLARAIETAWVHCRPGGAALFAPDHTRETFKASTTHGGHDRGTRSLRYLEWTWDPDVTDTTYISDMVYVLREGAHHVRCVLDRHTCGLFGHNDWLQMMARVGFEARSLPFAHTEIEPGSAHVFLGHKPDRS